MMMALVEAAEESENLRQYLRAVDRNAGYGCHSCRAECLEAEMPPPCETEGGILEDGTCQLGFPEILPQNKMPLMVWGDVNQFGWELVRDLMDLELTPGGQSDLLAKLRVLADESSSLQHARLTKESGDGD